MQQPTSTVVLGTLSFVGHLNKDYVPLFCWTASTFLTTLQKYGVSLNMVFPDVYGGQRALYVNKPTVYGLISSVEPPVVSYSNELFSDL